MHYGRDLKNTSVGVKHMAVGQNRPLHSWYPTRELLAPPPTLAQTNPALRTPFLHTCMGLVDVGSSGTVGAVDGGTAVQRTALR